MGFSGELGGARVRNDPLKWWEWQAYVTSEWLVQFTISDLCSKALWINGSELYLDINFGCIGDVLCEGRLWHSS